jgi:hypothetical protein
MGDSIGDVDGMCRRTAVGPLQLPELEPNQFSGRGGDCRPAASALDASVMAMGT